MSVAIHRVLCACSVRKVTFAKNAMSKIVIHTVVEHKSGVNGTRSKLRFCVSISKEFSDKL